jgi:hypothetical protein
VELCTLVNIDDPIGGRLAVPDGIVEESLDSVEDNLRKVTLLQRNACFADHYIGGTRAHNNK